MDTVRSAKLSKQNDPFPFHLLLTFSLLNQSQLQLNIGSLQCSCAELTWAEPQTWCQVFTANSSVVSLQRPALGNYNSPWCSSRWLFPPLSYLQWRHDTVFEVLHSYTAMNQSDQLSDLSVATKHGIPVPQASCHPNGPELRETGTTALIPTWNNVLVCGPEHPREKGWFFPTGGAEDIQFLFTATQHTPGLRH